VEADSHIADTTQLLLAWAGGDAAALDALAPRVYHELHRLAVDFMKREREEPVLQATALVHEVYLKLIDVHKVALEGKAHFFAICAQMMRRILVDSARARGSGKRGGGAVRVDVEGVCIGAPDRDASTIALDDALSALADFDLRKAQVIELRYFGGLSVEETAEVLKISPQSVMRDWKLAKAWLMREMTDVPPGSAPGI
jgi:RNA polymerase sigma-70 factor, ECF subfamily